MRPGWSAARQKPGSACTAAPGRLLGPAAKSTGASLSTCYSIPCQAMPSHGTPTYCSCCCSCVHVLACCSDFANGIVQKPCMCVIISARTAFTLPIQLTPLANSTYPDAHCDVEKSLQEVQTRDLGGKGPNRTIHICPIIQLTCTGYLHKLQMACPAIHFQLVLTRKSAP